MVVKFAKYIFSNLKKNHYRSTYPIFILFMLTSPKKKIKINVCMLRNGTN